MQQRLSRLILILVAVFGVALMASGAAAARADEVPNRPTIMQLPRMGLHARVVSNSLLTAPPGNFPFQIATSADGLLKIYYYNQSSGFGQQILTAIQGYINHPIKDTLGYGLKSVAHIYLYNSRADFLAGAQPDNPDETGAYTDFSASSIYTPILQDNGLGLVDFLPHELTHIVFHQNNDIGHIQDQYLRFFPLWLDEGLATSDQAEGSLQVQGFEQAIYSDPFYDIFTVFRYEYPTDSNVDFDCYAEARSFITFIQRTYGMTAFHQFIQLLHNGDYNQAMQGAFGADMQTIRSKWQVSIGRGALKHDAGLPIATTIAQPYQPYHINGPAVQANLTPIDGQGEFVSGALSRGLLITVLGLLGVAGGWLMTFLQRRNARNADLPPAASVAVPGAPYPPYYSAPAPGYPPPSYGPPTAQGYPPPSGPPSTPGTFYSPPPAAYASIPERETAVTTAIRSKPLPRYPWVTLVSAALIAPLVVAIETAWPSYAPTLEWSTPYRVAAIVAVLASVAMLGLGIFALIRQRVNVAHGVGLVVAIILALGAITQVRPLALAQAKTYAQNNYLTLARQLKVSNGATGADIAHIDDTWAGEALSIKDYAAGITHLRLALSEDPHNAMAGTWHTELSQAVDNLGTALVAAHQFDPAEATYYTQMQSRTCDAGCQTIVQQGGSLALLAWARDLLTHKNVSDATAKLQLASTRYGQSDGGKSAARVIAAQGDPLKGAFAAASAKDAQAASLLALLAAIQQPTAAAQASEVSVLVSGRAQEGDHSVNPKGDQLIFMGFTTKNGTYDWLNSTVYSDKSSIKVITTLGDNGTFTTTLPPGYWYLPLWDDPTQAANNYFNFVIYGDRGVFYVGAYQPLSLGVLNGY